MSHPDLSLGGPDTGHLYPLYPHGNLAHTQVATTTWSVDDILTMFDVPTVNPSDGSSRTERVWALPNHNRATAIK